jgi:hypothetical protein
MGSNNTPADAHPRFGFSEKRLIDESLTDGSLTGTAVMRTAGLRDVVALGVFTLTGGSGEVGFRIEASNDGVNWFTLTQTSPTQLFTTNGQVEILNDAGSGQVDLEHFVWIRARATIVSGAPTFSLQVIVSGIANDCEKFLRDVTFGPRLGTAPAIINGTMKPRPAGTLLTNVQVNASGVVLGGLTSFDVALQGSPDGGTTWVDIGVVAITADGSELMAVDGETFFSMGSYFYFRVQVRDNGAASGSTAYEAIEVLGTLDSCDWVLIGADSGGADPFDPSEVFIAVGFGAPGPEAADIIPISLQVFDASGAPLAEIRKIELILYDTSNAGDIDLSLNAIFDAVSVGTAIDGLATNRLVLLTDASGAATVDIENTSGADTNYLTAVNNRGPQAMPQLIAKSGEATLVFA